MKKIIASVLLAVACVCAGMKMSAQAVIEATMPTDGIYVEDATGIRRPMPIVGVRESDIMWKKRVWRELDFRQKMNQCLYYPVDSIGNWKSLVRVLIEAIDEGRITAYSAKIDELTLPLTISEADSLLMKKEYNEKKGTYIYGRMSMSNIQRLRIKEDWYFDRQKSQLQVRIIAICPVAFVEKDDNNNNNENSNENTTNNEEKEVEINRTPLFWIPYDDNTRQVLAEHCCFNRSNSAMRLTYDEIFCNRIFDSYIYKEDNVYNRSIEEYATGIDAMLESERIKQSIIDFEQNLWEY